MKKTRLLSLDISLGTRQEFIDKILELGGSRTSSYVCLANVHMTIESYWNKKFASIVNNADLALPDGMPLAKSLNLLFNIRQERLAGMDLLPYLVEAADNAKQSVFFYGTTQDVLDKIREKIKQDYPNLTVAGMYSPPFRKLSEEEELEIINKINDSGANMVFVALGCPKQETWMANHRGRINAVMLGLGGAFLVFADLQKRAPNTMQKFGLEWLYRLYQEPGRLWKRYLVTNSTFIWLVMKEAFRMKVRGVNPQAR